MTKTCQWLEQNIRYRDYGMEVYYTVSVIGMLDLEIDGRSVVGAISGSSSIQSIPAVSSATYQNRNHSVRLK